MKKTFQIFALLFFGIILNSYSQSNPQTDFYAGKWEILIMGTPLGDIKFHTNLVRKDGVLSGELAYADDAEKEKRPITKISENGDKISIFFMSQQGGEVAIELTKQNENSLKGSISGYDANATRLK